LHHLAAFAQVFGVVVSGFDRVFLHVRELPLYRVSGPSVFIEDRACHRPELGAVHRFARAGASTGRNYFYDGSNGEFVYAGFLIKFSLDPKSKSRICEILLSVQGLLRLGEVFQHGKHSREHKRPNTWQYANSCSTARPTGLDCRHPLRPRRSDCRKHEDKSSY
jgi:hypothetical protein